MAKIVKKEIQDSFNLTALQLAGCPRGSADAGETENLRTKLWELFLKYYDDGEERTLDLFVNALESYDAGKGPFANYFNYILARRQKDYYHFEQTNAEGYGVKGSTIKSLDSPRSQDAGDDRTLAETEPDSGSPSAELIWLAESDEIAWTQYLLFRERYTAEKIREERKRWFHILFTEEMTRKYKEREFRFLSEKDVFRAVNTGYLDYYMSEAACRKAIQVAVTPLKPYEAVVPARAGHSEEVPLPIPGDVSAAYLHSISLPGSEAGHAQMKKLYEKEREDFLHS